jgi:predicted regulator of Ras-like GTPase activity (Roadblock/LC7/MglB family)
MIQSRLDEVRNRYPGAQTIAISDKDGVEILSSPSTCLSESDSRRNAQIISTIFSLLEEQAQKIDDFGHIEYLISEFGDESLLIQASLQPIVITVKADRMTMSDANVIDMLADTKALLSDLREKVDSVVQS